MPFRSVQQQNALLHPWNVRVARIHNFLLPTNVSHILNLIAIVVSWCMSNARTTSWARPPMSVFQEEPPWHQPQLSPIQWLKNHQAAAIRFRKRPLRTSYSHLKSPTTKRRGGAASIANAWCILRRCPLKKSSMKIDARNLKNLNHSHEEAT